MDGTRHAGAVLDIDLDALAENWRRLAARADGAVCAGVVKANGYGLDAGRVAPALAAAGCRNFFVATLDEAISLRAVLAEAEIHVLNGLPPGSASEFRAHGLIPVLNQLGEIDSWGAHARSARAERAPGTRRAVLHVDTGMNRLGLPAAEVERLAEDPGRLAGIEVALVMSHLACAEEPEHDMNARQLARFERLRALLPAAPASLANSSGIFLGRGYHFDMVRPGAALYGINPTPGVPNPMAEVVRLRANILQVRDIAEGESVGYGAAHRAAGPGRIATVPVGYADGYLRALSQRGFGMVAGVRVPIVGRVSMDLVTLDVSRLPAEQARPGTPVDLVGGGLDIDEVAELAGTIGYELLVRLGRRFRRVYRGGESPR